MITATIGRTTAMMGPIKPYDTAIESTPVSGTDTMNDATAGLLAPLRLSAAAVGSTPQEHNGSGAPRIVAQRMLRKPGFPRRRATICIGTNSCRTPASVKPSRMNTELS